MNCSYKKLEEIYEKWKMERHLINALIMHLYECVINYISVKEVNYRRAVCLRHIDNNSLLFWIWNLHIMFVKFVFSATSIYHYLTKYWILSYYVFTLKFSLLVITSGNDR